MPENKFDIFISYSRLDLERVKAIKQDVELTTGASCWMDLEGIESGEQFEKVIISAINRSDTMLFMLSKSSMNSEWALDELDFAKKKKKRIVIVHLEDVEQSDRFYFRYHKYDQIKWNDKAQRAKLFRDIKKWNGNLPELTNIGESKKSTKKLINIVTPTLQKQSSQNTQEEDSNLYQRGIDSIKQILTRIKAWLIAFAGLLCVVIVTYMLMSKCQTVNIDEPRTTTDSLTTNSQHVQEQIAIEKILMQSEVVPLGQNGDKSQKNNKDTLSKKERYVIAKKNNDWTDMRKLADEGYSPAYIPLATHYLNRPSTHHLADKYAQKAKELGIPDADTIIKQLKDYDYY